MANKIVTTMPGSRVLFDEMPNQTLSGKAGTIRGAHVADGRIVYSVLLDDTQRLVESTASFFKVVQP